MKNNIKIYGVKDAYIKYLSQYQEHLFLHEGDKKNKWLCVIGKEVQRILKLISNYILIFAVYYLHLFFTNFCVVWIKCINIIKIGKRNDF